MSRLQELQERRAYRGHTILKVHRGKSILFTDETATLADPVCRSELRRVEREDPDWARLLAHLAEAGPSEVGDLLVELELKPKELKALRSPLERCGALVSRQVIHATADGGHVHTGELARWDQVHPEPSARGGLGQLMSRVSAQRSWHLKQTCASGSAGRGSWSATRLTGLLPRNGCSGPSRAGSLYRRGNERPASAGSTCAVTQTGVTAYFAEYR